MNQHTFTHWTTPSAPDARKVAPVNETEQRLPQYGPAWVAAALNGSAVRNGNVVTR